LVSSAAKKADLLAAATLMPRNVAFLGSIFIEFSAALLP
jgi:hypothetical protein